MELQIEDDDLILVEWYGSALLELYPSASIFLTLVGRFKLHLVPESVDSAIFRDLDVQNRLPPGKTVIDVFADFLSYLFQCAKTYLIEALPNGSSLWTSVADRIEIILSHPNGWEGLQQGKMREAAAKAGLIPDTVAGHARLHFVSEGEASLHYCVDIGMTSDFKVRPCGFCIFLGLQCTKDSTNAIVIDAGGGTVDLSTYCFRTVAPVAVEEVAPTDCTIHRVLSIRHSCSFPPRCPPGLNKGQCTNQPIPSM